jgi:outer membrane protein assembly factor BamB
MIWVATALLVLLAAGCLVGVWKAAHLRTKATWGAGCVIGLVAVAAAYLTGFTFHLNASAPVAQDDLVYLVPNCLCVPDSNIDTNLEAVRVRDGMVQWRHPLRKSGLGTSDTFISDAQHVYVLQYAPDAAHQNDYVVTALDAHSGRQVWQAIIEGGAQLVSAGNGRVTLSNINTTLILDAGTGRELLRLPVGNAYRERDGIVYACSGVNDALTITATAEATGHQLWRSPTVFGCGLALTPGVLLASGNGILTAIRLTDGSALWQVREGAALSPASVPMTIGNTVYTSVPAQPYPHGRGSGVVNARSLSDGTLRWQKAMGTFPVLYVAADNIVLAANDSALIALRGSDGRAVWSFPQADGSPGVLTELDGVVLVGYVSSRQIVALDLQRGSLYWQTTL